MLALPIHPLKPARSRSGFGMTPILVALTVYLVYDFAHWATSAAIVVHVLPCSSAPVTAFQAALI
jgi:hypothetical protein